MEWNGMNNMNGLGRMDLGLGIRTGRNGKGKEGRSSIAMKRD